VTLRFALFGAGRIGAIHAGNLARNPNAELRYVVDVNAAAAQKLASAHEAVAADAKTALDDASVGAVLVASSTDTHADLCIASAKAGKAIFCEKPIDLSLARVDECIAAVNSAGVPMLVGFNRRFDPSFAALKRRLDRGEIGSLEQVIISSRDPAPPPLAYVRVSGGLFRDMMIHDFDMARWLLGEEPRTLFAAASAIIDADIGHIGDVDSAMVVLHTGSGRLCHINNSRRAAYGYDQRIEVHGSKGRLMASNLLPTTVEIANADAVASDKPHHFFLERYAEAYANELDQFIAAVNERRSMPVSAEDGRRALVLAEAAIQSVKSGQAVSVAL
jgi:myo-inositol 2-dehydrogenase / D-chiro-inositol 1-dehydrogenase